MELTQGIREKVKENAGKTCCVSWLLCGAYCIYTIPHVHLFSTVSLLYFTLGLFISSILFGAILYFIKMFLFHLSEYRPFLFISGPLQWFADIAIIYPMYKVAYALFLASGGMM